MMPPSAATTTDMSQLVSTTTTVHFDNTLGAVVIGAYRSAHEPVDGGQTDTVKGFITIAVLALPASVAEMYYSGAQSFHRLYGVSCVHFYRYANASSSDGSMMRGTVRT